MAGNTVKDMTTNFGKLDKFEGHDFRRWQKKMHFLLTTLKVVYVLTTPMPELLEDATVEAIRIRAKWENDDYICRGHILNGMSDSLFDVYTNVESAKELWDSLESKYIAEDYSSKKFLDFKHTLKHGKDDLSLVQLGSHLRIEESLRAHDSDKGKGKEVGGPSVNMTEEGKNKHNKQNKGKKRSNENNSGSSSNKKPKLECWKCGKTGHFKRDCRSGKKNNANAGGSGKGSKDQSQDQGQNLVNIWNSFVKYSVSLISEAFYVQVDAIAWWIDSGATTHVCKDRCWFKTFEPVEDGSVLYMGDEHFAPIHGKGSVALEFSSGKIVTLFNVLYVPKLRKNLVSGPVLNKCGYKQVYESDKYILSKCGVFVGFGYYNNGMFMLNLNKVPDDSDSVYMSSSTVVNSTLWHARLGHVHYKRMLEMSKDDLIPAIDENLKK
ncbi:zinc finger, CCHC-type containing protein [Tanacetum coccineum]